MGITQLNFKLMQLVQSENKYKISENKGNSCIGSENNGNSCIGSENNGNSSIGNKNKETKTKTN